jgi:glutaminyl-tRNA synthetase
LTNKQQVGLRHVNLVVRVVRIVPNGSGGIEEVVVRAEPVSAENKPKAFIHWVAQPVQCEARLYEKL